MERKETISGCKFIGIEGNKLSYKCKEYNNKLDKPMNELIKKFSNIYINFVMKILINLICY